MREQILNCLGTLTRTVEGTKGFCQFYSGDKRLWEAAESLYLALLDAVQDILAWLDDSAWRRTFSALFKQENYSKPFEEKIKTAVETRVKEFHEQLEHCQHGRIQKIHIGVDGMLKSVHDLQDEVQKSEAVRQKNHEDIRQSLAVLCQYQEYVFDWQLKTHEYLQEAIGQLARKNHDPTIILTLRQPMITAAALLALLQVEPDQPGEDSRLAVSYGQTLRPERQDRAASLLHHARFQAWLKTGFCEILIVNGKDTQSVSATLSPLTYVIALLRQTLISTQTAIPLLCICGRHASPDDPLESAEGALRLLTHQLLLYLGDAADLAWLDWHSIEAIRSGNIQYLCELFRSLIVSLVMTTNQPCTVVCLIEGVSFLETSARLPGLEILVAFLQQLVLDINGLGGFLVFKVLLTYPYMSRYAQDWFPPEAILTMGEEVGGDRQGFNSARLATVSESLVLGRASP